MPCLLNGFGIYLRTIYRKINCPKTLWHFSCRTHRRSHDISPFASLFDKHAKRLAQLQEVIVNTNYACVYPIMIAVTLSTIRTNTQQLSTTIPHVIQPLAVGEAWLAGKTSLPLPAQETQQFKIFSLQFQFI